MRQKEFLALCQNEFERKAYPMTQDMNMADLVALIQESGARIAKALLESRMEEDPRRDPQEIQCRQCQGKLRIQERSQRRLIQTALGEIEYRRAYGVCDRCGHSGAPLDEALGIPAFGPSAEARRKICHAAVVGRSFEDGREILKEHSAIAISAKHVRKLSEEEGALLAKQRRRELEAYRQRPLKAKNSEEPELLAVAADGGRVQIRGEDSDDRWKEDKIGVVYDAAAQPQKDAEPGSYEGAKARTKTYVASMENWESFGWMLRVEAERRGYAKAKVKLFLADGALHIRELKNLQFPEAVFILDWAHAAQHLSHCAKALFGDGTLKANEWYQLHRSMLWEGKRDEIIEELKKHSRRLGVPEKSEPDTSPRKVIHQNAYSYFPNNREALDYPAFRAKGWPIGSGVAEGAVKQFALRLKGSEKFWNVSNSGAEEMLALCALYHSEDCRWDRYWKRRAQAR